MAFDINKVRSIRVYTSRTREEFISIAKDIHGDKYDYSKVIVRGENRVRITCPIHGDFLQKCSNHLRGCGCAECAFKSNPQLKPKDTKWFIKRAHQVHGYKYDYSLVNYVDNKTKVNIHCKKCEKNFLIRAMTHVSRNGENGHCPFCYPKKVRITNIKEFIDAANKVHGNKYDYSKVNYIKTGGKIIIICPSHDEFLQRRRNHLRGTGCPNCNESKGEQEIANWLKNHNITFIRQHTFKNCKYKRLLRFDFYLPDYNVCIEFNGPQHYRIVNNIRGKKYLTKEQALATFRRQKLVDSIKIQYCKKNGIKLICIKRIKRNNLNFRKIEKIIGKI